MTWHATRPFKSFAFAVYCTACLQEMPLDAWPSHWRTKAHRENRRTEASRPRRAAADILARLDVGEAE